MMDIEQLPSFVESGRQFVLRQPAVGGPTGIGHNLAADIADRDHDASTHQTWPVVKPHAKLGGGDAIDAPLL